MYEYDVENHLENLELYLEHDSGYPEEQTPEVLEAINAVADIKIAFDHTEEGVLEGFSYITVDTNYCLNLSPGQQRLYEILVSLQEAAVYSVTTIGKLAEAMDLENPMAAGKRLQNLQLLGAISGFKI